MIDSEIWFDRIYSLLLFFVIIRIIGWWISVYIKEKYMLIQTKSLIKQDLLLELILKELKEKNKDKE